MDFRSGDSRYLFISADPGDPRVYLIKRKLRELEKASTAPTPFHLLIQKRLSGAELASVEQVPDERVLFFNFSTANEVGEPETYVITAQLTGKSANLFLLDADRTIVGTIRETAGTGQRGGDTYHPPERKTPETRSVVAYDGVSPSEVLDRESFERAAAKRFQSLVASARGKLRREITKRTTLVKKLATISRGTEIRKVGNGLAIFFLRMRAGLAAKGPRSSSPITSTRVHPRSLSTSNQTKVRQKPPNDTSSGTRNRATRSERSTLAFRTWRKKLRGLKKTAPGSRKRWMRETKNRSRRSPVRVNRSRKRKRAKKSHFRARDRSSHPTVSRSLSERKRRTTTFSHSA